ncbi:tyrosine-protein kinase domain-containing protein [Sphingomonas profundi]|uniref:tyrosine-protein kinase domain-containing protein n=1 Tax=Alterirhizorhabdus profundi TaxID=2681549 RepID=UPI0018D130D4|nr:tyrosine-protein kinase domain-containing protein [Sphingomonas profundi]
MRDETPPVSRLIPLAPHEVRLSRAAGRFGPEMILSAVRRRIGIFLAVLGTAIAVALAASLLQPSLYTASAEVLLDASGGGRGPAGDGAGDEMLILRSREMAVAVARGVRPDAAALDARGPVARLIGGAAADGERQVVDRLIAGLAVSRMADTYALTIAYTARDPAVAARIANEYARQYVAGRLAGMEGTASPLDRPFARIISGAEPPLLPSSPRPLRAVALGALAGLLLGIVAALLAERRFAGITSGRDIGERLGLSHLGSVPTLKSVLPQAASPLEAMVSAQSSGFAEAFRGVMMAIRHAGGRGTQLIAISSALPNEGKTTVSACLARSIALGGESVVLIDCDARRRDTTALFGLSASRPGLVEVLRYEATLDEALVRDEASGAWILPLTGPAEEISELLAGQGMVALLEDLRRRFKRVLIDTAPILAISATRAIATMADVTVLVVRWRATADHAIMAAAKLLPSEHVRIAGVVLAQVDLARQTKFGHGDPTFYYEQYSKYYS